MSTPYEVEAIIGRRVFSGKVLYLAKWKDFPLQDATWQSVKVLKPYRHLIKLYNEQHRNEGNHSLSANQQDLPSKLEQHDPSPEIARVQTPEFHKDYQSRIVSESHSLNQKSSRKRGRPKKSMAESKQESTKDGAKLIREDKTLLSKDLQADLPENGNRKAESEAKKDEENEERQEKTDYKNGLCKIYLIGKEREGHAEYIVQDKSGHLSKLSSIQMLRLYPEALVQYLQRTLFTRFAHNLPYF